jgi:hypothetical protein
VSFRQVTLTLAAVAAFAGCASRSGDRDSDVPAHDAPSARLPPAPTHFFSETGKQTLTPSTTFLVVGFRGELPPIDGWVPLPQTLDANDQMRCSVGRDVEAIRCMAASELFRRNNILVLGRNDVSSEPIEQVAAILLAGGAQHACPVYGDPFSAPLVVTDEITVGLAPDGDRNALEELSEARKDVIVGEVQPLSFRLKTRGGWCAAVFEANVFADTGKFRYAQPNFVNHLSR